MQIFNQVQHPKLAEPLGFGGARNFYVYAGNDGVNYVDMDGLKEETVEDTVSNIYGTHLINFMNSEVKLSTPYNTWQDAFNAILKIIYCKTKKENKEYCAFQYQDRRTGLHYNSILTKGSNGSCNPYRIYGKNFTFHNLKILSDLHSHTPNGDNSAEDYSDDDMKMWNEVYKITGKGNYLGYMISPKGVLWKYYPSEKDIFDYSLPKIDCSCK